MATVQQSIDINIPIHAVYGQLTRFEDYPRFMEEVDEVRQIDDTHLHWKTIMSNRSVEWDAEITEREQDQCIAWRNISGPTNSGRVDVQPVGADKSRVTLTLHAEPEQVPGSSAGNEEQEMSQRLKLDLVRLKEFIETSRQQSATSHGERLLTEDGMPDAQGDRGSPRNSPVPMSSYAAGSEGWSGDEDTTSPMTSMSPSSSSSHEAQAVRGAQSPGLQAVPERGAQPGAGRAADGGSTGVGGTAAAVGAAGARMSGSKGAGHGSGAPGGAAIAGTIDAQGGSAQGNRVSPGAGASAAGGTGLGSSATADDTRTGTGTESGSGTALTGGSGGGAGNTKGSAGPSDKP